MISFIPQGRLGNFMFKAAAAIAYSIKYNIEFSMPSITNSQKWNSVYYQHLVSPKWNNESKDNIFIQEKNLFKYDDILFKEEWRGKQIILDGYFQNVKYFKDYKETINKLLSIGYFSQGKVGIHVRRGDYLTIPDKHIVPTVDWYKKAMTFFPNYQFVFFSDDIKWCEDNFSDRDDCLFMKGFDEFTDFITLSKCEHFINSSSTFSWMAAWLNCNPDKKVITPAQWMTPRCTNQWTNELLLDEWIKLSV